MRDEDWQLLGLAEPTADLLAIKRAYAARLKHTRPDDDAEAYQVLRQTYEWAQQWARWQTEVSPGETGAPPPRPAETPEPVEPLPHPSPATEAAAPSSTPSAPLRAEPAPPMLPTARPEALVARAHQIWLEQGEAAFRMHWPALRAGLDDLPLADMPEASARMAEMVIQVRDLPDASLIELDRYFGWREDFRTERHIGPQRAHALLRLLDERIVRPITDPGMLEQIEPLMRVARLASARRKPRALLHAVLSGGLLLGLYDALPARQWRALGHDAVAQVALRALIGRAGSIRLGLAVLALAVAMGLGNLPGLELVPVLGSIAIASLFLHFVTMWVTGSLGGWFGLRWRTGTWVVRLREWHGHPRRLALGFATLGLSLLAAVWAESAWAPDWPLLPGVPWFVLVLLGAMALWPQDLRHGAVLVLAAGVGTGIAFGVWPGGGAGNAHLPAALSLGLTWALLASNAYERGWWGTREARAVARPQAWPLAPVINSLALCDRWGINFAMAPVPLLVGLVMAGLVADTPWGLFIGWTLLVLGFGWGQEQLFKWGERLARRPGA